MNNKIIAEIRKKQDELIVMINTTFDQIVNDVSKLKNINNANNQYELIYPLTNAGGFKGKKVIAVIINNKRYIAATWKTAVKIILEDALSDKQTKKKIMDLRDIILGRTRNRLSKSSTGMRSPIELDKNLYIETHYDTESLIKLLLEILNDVSYDFSNIRIVIKN